jgi:2-phosphosulfolactate phosphatase
LNIEMALLPSLVRDTPRQVCIVVDVLRATSTISAFFERGVREIHLGANLEEVAAIGSRLDDCLLAGERGGMAPAGFDFSNSPTQILRSPADLKGRVAAFSTTNGTRAIRQLVVEGAPLVLTGCVRNGPAVAKVAIAEARRRGCDVTVVASGRENGTKVCLDDVIACGYIVYLLRQGAKLDNRPASAVAQLIAEDDDPDYVQLDHAAIDLSAYAGTEEEDDYEEEQRNAITRYPFIPWNAVGLHSEKPATARMAEEGATLALRLYLSYIGEYNDNPAQPSRRAFLAAFNECSGGHHLLRYGWAADTVAVSEAGVCHIVPYVEVTGERLILHPIGGEA